jgi:2-polyprenyl-6-methoxyphenol hydroxylase-like FAD-dependent oxidoreductase
VEKAEYDSECWSACVTCHGQGKLKRRLKKKIRLQYQLELEKFEKSNGNGQPPVRALASDYPCPKCTGLGILQSPSHPCPSTENYPHIAIVGGGIGGVALAVACLHRGIPFTLYEWDENFEARSQGYGLTLQQASKAIEAFGIKKLEEGVVSTRHVVHSTDGKIIGEWGMRKWIDSEEDKGPKKTNVHIARQALRLALLEKLGTDKAIQWGHELIDFKEKKDEGVQLKFRVKGETKSAKADALVGADGIRSAVRNLLIGEVTTPLRYLDCLVILGICPLSALNGHESELLDSATVFQTANGHERIYMMPFSADTIMWQLSFPMKEEDAKHLSSQGPAALKTEAIKRCQWHSPIPEILEATEASLISGYPVYDRSLLKAELLQKSELVTLLGDAAHPMSPFKGQGANQALLDALSLAREITKGCRPDSNWQELGLREAVLNGFEAAMLERSSVKVKDSADAAQFLHSDIALHESNEPRGRVLKRKNEEK